MALRNEDQSTIAALATPPGRGAVAIVRISGPAAMEIACQLTRCLPQPRRAELCTFLDVAGEPIDQGLLLYFPAPHSYTGENVVELQGHGGQIVSDALLAAVFARGARPARPGEFTLRAYLNNKLDLAQAEAVADLIDSGSRRAAQAAARSLTGIFSARVHGIQAALTTLRVHVEAWLDFPDEELERAALESLLADFERTEAELTALHAEAEQGSVLRDGLCLAIAGPPNAGKSSLLNRLAGYDRAIVTDLPGTTRDVLREQLSLDGLPITLADTAGLRDTKDPIEREGVRRSHSEIHRADHVLWVHDACAPLPEALAAARAALGSATVFTLVSNKIDLIAETPGRTELDGIAVLRVSALSGAGFDTLRAHLKATAGYQSEVTGSFSARRRHLEALARAQAHIRRARDALAAALGLELVAEELRAAQVALSELTGELLSDDLLGEIFGRFCVGK
jgi:tRNA modification GTPase